MKYLFLICYIVSLFKPCIINGQDTLDLRNPKHIIIPKNSLIDQISYNPNNEELKIDSLILIEKVFKNAALLPSIISAKVLFWDDSFYNKLQFPSSSISLFAMYNSTAGLIDFSSSQFKECILFSTFNYALFDLSEFKSFTCGSTFFKKATFRNCKFDSLAGFGSAIFNDTCDLGSCYVPGSLSFAATKFTKYLNLSGLILTEASRIEFTNTKFPALINFANNSSLNSEIDFTTADFEDNNLGDKKHEYVKHKIFLSKSNVSKIHMDYTHFELTFVDPATQLAISIDEQKSIYESVLSNFKARGQQDSYQALDIEYQKFKIKHSWAPWLARLQLYWWNFGYDKEYIFAWTGGFILLFTMINFLFVKSLNEKVYTLERLPKIKPFKRRPYTFYDAMLRLWCSFVYSSNIFLRLTLKIDNINYEKILGTTYLMIMYLSGLLCVAYIANFIIQK